MKIYRVAQFDYSDRESSFVKMIQTPDLDSDTVAYLVQCYMVLTHGVMLDEDLTTEIIRHLTMDGLDNSDIVREINQMKRYVDGIQHGGCQRGGSTDSYPSYPSTLGTTSEGDSATIFN